MNFPNKIQEKEERCYFDDKLKVKIHRFKMGATRCECGMEEVKPKSNWGWKNTGGK
jgi:hypothetical protein